MERVRGVRGGAGVRGGSGGGPGPCGGVPGPDALPAFAGPGSEAGRRGRAGAGVALARGAV